MSGWHAGAFELIAPVGVGGMGEVWRAVHAMHRAPVAVKVIVGAHASDPAFITRFEREVQAVAALTHPGVCAVYDYGRVSPEAAAASADRLPAGSPWLAMELAEGGTLDDHPPRSWQELRDVLLMVLDALAHAHARHMVHRDIKPANVLRVLDAEGGLGRCVLTDFGLAHAFDPMLDGASAHHAETTVAGTPHYMPPEQLQGRWRAYGPWTDLYAVGCMAWELCTGLPPFDGGTFTALAVQHMGQEPPALRPRFAVPAGLEGWLRRLLQKRPMMRYTRAAEAVFDLIRLGDPSALTIAPAVWTGDAREGALSDEDALSRTIASAQHPLSAEQVAALEAFETIEVTDSILASSEVIEPALSTLATLRMTRDRLEEKISEDRRVVFPALLASPDGQAPSPRTLPLPWTWRALTSLSAASGLSGAGLGLFGLREIPFVGRRAERDQLWAALHRAYSGDGPQLVVVDGATGTGKSRLIEWIARRAEEVGATFTLKASHQAIPGPDHGLPGMLAAQLRCHGLSRPDMYAHLLDFLALGEEEAAALTELISPADPDAPPDLPVLVRFASAEERLVAWRLTLERLTSTRAALLWIDDAQWGAESLDLVRRALDRWTHLPLLCVVVVRRDALEIGGQAARALEGLLAHERAETIPLQALSAREHEAFIQALLTLHPELSQRLAERTQGNPLFAVQLVSDWVERGLLQPGADGFVLDAEADAALPEGVHEVWRARLTRLARAVGDTTGQTRAALELAAALGLEVELDEWHALLAIEGVSIPYAAIEHALASGLVLRTERGFAFAHAMLRESVELEAVRGGRMSRWHIRCAEMLASQPHADHPERQRRRALHLTRAGEDAQAFELFGLAAQGFTDRSDYPRALAMYDQREQCARRLGLASDDPRLMLDWIERAYALRHLGRIDEFQGWFRRVVEALPRTQDPRVHANFHRGMAMAAWLRGELLDAHDHASRATTIFDTIGDALGASRIAHAMGLILVDMGMADEALASYARGIIAAQRIANPREEAWSEVGRAQIFTRRGLHKTSATSIERARELFVRCGSRAGLGMVAYSAGELALRLGSLREAAARFEEAHAIWSRMGSQLVIYARTGMASVALAAGQPERARDMLTEVLRTSHIQDRMQNMLLVHLALAEAAAHLGDWPRHDAQLDEALTCLASQRVVHPDAAALLHRLALLNRAAHQPQRAHRAAELGLWCATAMRQPTEALAALEQTLSPTARSFG